MKRRIFLSLWPSQGQNRPYQENCEHIREWVIEFLEKFKSRGIKIAPVPQKNWKAWMGAKINMSNIFYFRVLFLFKTASAKINSHADVAQIRVDLVRRFCAVTTSPVSASWAPLFKVYPGSIQRDTLDELSNIDHL